MSPSGARQRRPHPLDRKAARPGYFGGEVAGWKGAGSRRAGAGWLAAPGRPTASASAVFTSIATAGARSTFAASSPRRSRTRNDDAGSISTVSRDRARRLPLHKRPDLVLPHRAVVLAERLREEVPAGVHGDEVEEARIRRRDGRLQGGRPGIADRTRWQAGVAIGVVARIDPQILLPDVPVEGVPHDERVDHGRIALQSHPETQPVVEDRSHERVLVGL